MPDPKQLRRIEILLATMMMPETVEIWWRSCNPHCGMAPQELLDQGRIDEINLIVNRMLDAF